MRFIIAHRQLKTCLRVIVTCTLFCAFSILGMGQTITADKTAAILASALICSGVVILTLTLICQDSADKRAINEVISPADGPNRIVLTSGYANDTTISGSPYYGMSGLFECLLALPNAFSPGSIPNVDFKIIKRGIATLEYFRIFNRWGNVVFETTDIDKGGTVHIKESQPFDVYETR
jgi:hypothetical protein